MMRTFTLPKESDLPLHRITNGAGLSFSFWPNGSIFAIEHKSDRGTIMINQVLGSPLDGGLGRVIARAVHDGSINRTELLGTGLSGFGAGERGAIWRHSIVGAVGLDVRCTLALHETLPVWAWRVDVDHKHGDACDVDVTLAQDLGLGGRGFLMNNEAYASQYIDHHVERDPEAGAVLMSRANLKQGGRHPWVMHACMSGASDFATDGLQFFGATRRVADTSETLGLDANRRVQHEMAMAVLRSNAARVMEGGRAQVIFVGAFDPDHATPSSGADLGRLQDLRRAVSELRWPNEEPGDSRAGWVATSPLLFPKSLDEAERADAERCIVSAQEEAETTRRHGHLVRSGRGLNLDESTMCSTAWMHGVFSAQLTLGNTSFHKLFSVSRDPYNVMRSSGLRMMSKVGEAWQMLGVPSHFEMGLSDCRWIYRDGDRTITVRKIAAAEDAAITWDVSVDGEPAELLIFGHLVLGEREYEQAGRVEIDSRNHRFTFRPDPDWLWGQRYPRSMYHLVTSTPGSVDAWGGDELLFEGGEPRGLPYVAIRTRATNRFAFSVVGDLKDPDHADSLAKKFEGGIELDAEVAKTQAWWAGVMRGVKVEGSELAGIGEVLPWFVHNAMVHLTVPHGLEQYTGAAWGTRDVCQGPVELLLALGHHGVVREILVQVFAQQYADRGDWPQWFMHAPYAFIQDKHAHGDIVVWPIKAVHEYIEATNDLAFLNQPVPWRREDNFEPTSNTSTVLEHLDKLIGVIRSRFIPGTSLIAYGEGDWNDALQPADPKMREWMVSSWTVAILYQSLSRYREVLERAGHRDRAAELASLLDAMKRDFNRHLVRDGVVAGYALFDPQGKVEPEYLLHPRDAKTGIHYSLLPMTRSTIGGLFEPDQAKRHLDVIREHLLFPDGVRLMDRPAEYRGGEERIFRRAESSSFFGREIGIMYVHAHLRYCEALARLGEADTLLHALRVVNPVEVADLVKSAATRQRNAYFSSSDAAFPDRYAASREWDKVRRGEVPVEGGWRIYSSGPGIYVNMVVRHLFGIRRHFDAMEFDPVLSRSLDDAAIELRYEDRAVRYEFHVREGTHTPKRIEINGHPLAVTPAPNPYRTGGVRASAAEFAAMLDSGGNVVTITV